MKKSRSINKKNKSPKKRIAVVHGPNLNLLGEREPEVYGRMTLSQLNKFLTVEARKHSFELRFFQSNSEGSLIDYLHKNRKTVQGIVINPGAYTHYSYALRDAISGIQVPTIEVHLSDIYSREDFRKISVIAPVCLKQISGKGVGSYTEALEFFAETLKTPRSEGGR